MILQQSFYKPNKTNTGSAFTFKYNRQEGKPAAFYITCVQQAGWNESTKTGSFKENASNPDKTINVKLSLAELGDFISFFHKRSAEDKISLFHDSSKAGVKGGGKVTIVLSRWGDKNEKYGLRITKDENKLSLTLSLVQGEAEVIAVLMQEAISNSLLYLPSEGSVENSSTGLRKVDYKAHKDVDLDEDEVVHDEMPF